MKGEGCEGRRMKGGGMRGGGEGKRMKVGSEGSCI